MGWTESNIATTKELVRAVKDLRAHLGDTQEAFADRLGLSRSVIANYEKDHRPTVAVLARLAKTASDAGLAEPTITFMRELDRDLKLSEIRGVTLWMSSGRGYALIRFDSEANSAVRS